MKTWFSFSKFMFQFLKHDCSQIFYIHQANIVIVWFRVWLQKELWVEWKGNFQCRILMIQTPPEFMALGTEHS